MEPGTLTKVLQDFLTTVDGELSLLKGDYLLVLSVVDKIWCYGQSHNNTGKFPTNYLHKVDIPDIKDNENLYISIAAFRGEQPGDLSFSKGEIIVGVNEAEQGWISGYTDSHSGIFPATHTWKLDTALIKKGVRRQISRRKAKVTANLEAQLDEELDLTKGTIVTVTEILEDGWCRGETEDGRTGIFPQGFVEFLEGLSDESIDDQESMTAARLDPLLQKKFGKDSAMHYDEEPAPCYYELFPEFAAEDKNSDDKVKGKIDDYDVPVDNNLNPFGVDPYAITLYPFNAQFPNELSFTAGEVVRLIKHKDSEWAEGSIDNVKGIFPVSYVNIIVDCPNSVEPSPSKSAEDEEAAVELEAASKAGDSLVPGVVVKVEYKFEAQMDGDLSVNEGDFVTVVEMANCDWVSVKNEDGVVGLCPRSYLNANFDSQSEQENSADEFVVLRNEEAVEELKFEDRFDSKRLSFPHRPAPPAPAPGRVPLQRQTMTVETQEETVEDVEESEAESRIKAKQKRADHRQNVITELVITEKEYVRDLKLTYETFNLYNPSILESRGIDVTTLFGNMLDVIKIAEDLLDKMLSAMKGCDEEYQTIGPCFSKMSDKLQVVYVKYCSNHEAALALLKKYENNSEIMVMFEKGIETLRHQIACFDMSSILIKPVQRILKYPLMLYELVKCTEDDHPDKPEIEEAWRAMTNVASYINEYKRRKDLVTKYFEGENTLMRKMAKLNMHSVAKKSTRLSAKLSASLGLTNIALDTDFDEYERQFKSLEKSTWQLARDVEQCIVYLGEEAVSGQLISDLINQYYQGTSNNEVRKFNETRSIIWSTYLQELKSCLERRVSTPLNHLINLLQGPALLIEKRYDKLLDYDVAVSKNEKNRDNKIFQDELLRAKSNYEALNEQLLEELPTLIKVSTKILVSCFGAFTNSRKLLSGQVTKRYLALSETATQITAQDILESFLVSHNLLWNQITRFGFAGSNPRIEESQVAWNEQSERQRNLLRSKYPTDRLYVVKENVVSTSSLDMGAKRGTIVAVIKNQDPMGDSTRWFVDNGALKGFLPSQNLEVLHRMSCVNSMNGNRASMSPDTIADSISLDSSEVIRTESPDLICMDSPEKESKTSSIAEIQSQFYQNLDDAVDDSQNDTTTGSTSVPQHYQNLNDVFYYALYNFDGAMQGTLPIKKGQALRLLRPCDEKKNDEWWLVQDRSGASGYVPKNYLGPPEALA
ncbi:dynamin-binding protein-like [Diprion similis]|uniref:dynamin-binding protein-like n=1 Tax=Diprion similis TaxID=362088 RepID=UPI001EF7D09B|nr:dynamin-binding protein-like [Diprion similis]